MATFILTWQNRINFKTNKNKLECWFQFYGAQTKKCLRFSFGQEIFTYPVKYLATPGKSALMNFLMMRAILPLRIEWRSLTMRTRHTHRMTSATIRMMIPAAVSLRSHCENSASPAKQGFICNGVFTRNDIRTYIITESKGRSCFQKRLSVILCTGGGSASRGSLPTRGVCIREVCLQGKPIWPNQWTEIKCLCLCTLIQNNISPKSITG